MGMNDSRKIIAGLAVFIVLVTIPVWYNRGKASTPPNLVLPKEEKNCVEDTDYMKTSHMQLLNDWRTAVVRDGNRMYQNKAGRTFKINLTDTCLDCHASKADFCDRCHTYADVKPNCWECHIDQKGSL
jgi:hypothetical protein